MKRIFILFLTLALGVSVLGGCEKTQNSDEVAKKVEESVTNKEKNTTQEAVGDDSKESNSKAEEENKPIDKNLTGLELLKSVEYKVPKSYVIETDMTMTDGSVSKTTTYMQDSSTRIETISALTPGKLIMIYDAKEGATYQYTEGEKTGILMLDGEDENDETMERDMSAPSLKDLVDGASENIVAKLDTLEGEEVVYIETTESEEDMGDVKVCMWYSTRYSIPLKYEMYMNGAVVIQSVVKKLEVNINIDEDLFKAPKDVKFEEFSIDSMFPG